MGRPFSFDWDDRNAGHISRHDTCPRKSRDQMRQVPPFKLPTAQVDAIRTRHAGRRAAVSLSLEPAQIRDTRRIAARKSIGYQTQLHLWIAEGIHREKARTR
jgi:hypothetical protein